jgi:predicted MFS family arabinose efflux permease
VLGGVAYEHLGMVAPLVIATLIILAMFAFATLSRRLRDSVVARSAAELEPT